MLPRESPDRHRRTSAHGGSPAGSRGRCLLSASLSRSPVVGASARSSAPAITKGSATSVRRTPCRRRSAGRRLRCAAGDRRISRSWNSRSPRSSPYRPRRLGVCDSALAAADFDAALVRPSRRVADARVAAEADVTLGGAFLCESALAAALLAFGDALGLRITAEAFEAARLPVSLLIGISRMKVVSDG